MVGSESTLWETVVEKGVEAFRGVTWSVVADLNGGSYGVGRQPFYMMEHYFWGSQLANLVKIWGGNLSSYLYKPGGNSLANISAATGKWRVCEDGVIAINPAKWLQAIWSSFQHLIQKYSFDERSQLFIQNSCEVRT